MRTVGVVGLDISKLGFRGWYDSGRVSLGPMSDAGALRTSATATFLRGTNSTALAFIFSLDGEPRGPGTSGDTDLGGVFGFGGGDGRVLGDSGFDTGFGRLS